MPPFNNNRPLGPGFYVQETDISTPDVPQGALLPAIIGQGSKTLQRTQPLVKGSANGKDGPLTQLNVINIVSVIDANSVTYTQGVDYQLTLVNGQPMVDWSLQASLTGTGNLSTITYPSGLDGLHLTVTVNGVLQDIVFTAPANAAAVITQINQWVGFSLASEVGTALVLTANSIEIEGGNANSLLGFTQGAFASVQEVATGTTYTVTYVSDKLVTEYAPQLFSNMNDLIAYHGTLHPNIQLFNGTLTGATSTVITDTTEAFTVNALVGNYVTIISGGGSNQVRVIISNTATSITVSQPFNANNLPTMGSTYSITDVNNNTITLGAQTAFDAGATMVITSQYPDNLFDSSNIKPAIDALATPVQGVNPYCLVLMRGLGATEEAPIAYLQNHVDTYSGIPYNQFRIAIIGLAQGNTNFTTFANIATATADRRITLVNISTIQKDFGDGQGPVNLDGSYVAAALAGLVCANVDAGTPITYESIGSVFNVDTFSDPFLVNEKNFMEGAGVTVVERRGVDIIIRHALTTDNTDAFTQELKLTRAADYVSNYLKTNMEGALIGKRESQIPGSQAGIVQTAKTTLNLLLNSLTGPPEHQIIYDFQNVNVVANGQDSRELDITASIYLTPDVIWVYANLGFGS